MKQFNNQNNILIAHGQGSLTTKKKGKQGEKILHMTDESNKKI